MEYKREQILQIIADKLNVDLEEMKPESHLVDDLGGDSLDSAEIIVEIEKKLNIVIPLEYLEKLRTVEDIFTALDKM